MKDELDPLAAERQFFAALVDANVETLDRVLVDDFILIDVMSGSEISSKPLSPPTLSCACIRRQP